jgi:hypothetical protein
LEPLLDPFGATGGTLLGSKLSGKVIVPGAAAGVVVPAGFSDEAAGSAGPSEGGAGVKVFGESVGGTTSAGDPASPPQPVTFASKNMPRAHITTVTPTDDRNLFVKIIFFLHIRQGGLSFMMTVEKSTVRLNASRGNSFGLDCIPDRP